MSFAEYAQEFGADAAHTSDDTDAADIRVYRSARRFLVWKPRDVYTLRVQHRMIGTLVGALPGNKRQMAEMGVPLALGFEEALLLAEESIAHVVDADVLSAADAAPGSTAVAASGFCTVAAECSTWAAVALSALPPAQLRHEASAVELDRARVFRRLWRSGLCLTGGLRFGADYLCYNSDPLRVHAHALVHVLAADAPLPPLVELLCAARLASSAKKSAVFARVDGDAVQLLAVTATGQLEPWVDVEGVPPASERKRGRE